MDELQALMHGFGVVLTPTNIALMFTGVILGVIIGVLPGLGGANGVAILLPLTFSMSPTSAIIMLSCIYWGALFGGAITSILFNIPGEPWSVATTFDGYPLAQKGRPGTALTAAFTSSFIGALLAVDEDLAVALLAEHGADHRGRRGQAQDDPEIEGEVAGARAVAGPAGAQLRAAHHDHESQNQEDECHDSIHREGGHPAPVCAGRVLLHFHCRSSPARVGR